MTSGFEETNLFALARGVEEVLHARRAPQLKPGVDPLTA